ncbi:glycosyl transferase family 2, partial [Pseudomonas sp. HMWF031]
MNSLPLVSLVIPAFNPRFFGRALHTAVSQSYGNLEIIVCDDSRGHEIEDIVNSVIEQGARVRYVRNAQTLGLVGNLQACLEQAQGEFIKFLCDDDQLFSACIERQAQVLIDCADVNLVVAQRLFWDADDMPLPSRLENT